MNSSQLSKAKYVDQVLKLFTGLAETPVRHSRIDRQLAEELYENQIAIEEVEVAMYLATLRRSMRDESAPKLGPIRSLHYFLPIIKEVRSVTLSPEYQKYLRHKAAASQKSW